MSEAKAWCVYVLECADGSLYTGITNDMQRRLDAHNRGVASRYTRARLPVVPRYTEQAADRSAASKREAAIKRMSRAQKDILIATPANPARRTERKRVKQ